VKPVVAELMDKIGMLLEVLTQGKHKDMFSLRKYTDEERDKLLSVMGDLYERFIDVVAESRGLTKEAVAEIATGEVWSAQEALELGLIDEIKVYEEVVEDLARETKTSPKRVIGVGPKKLS